jgi:hypothetical protein
MNNNPRVNNGDTYYVSELGQLHRANGPALIDIKGWWYWQQAGCPHRYYGPANVRHSWYIHGVCVKSSARFI